MVEAFNKLQVRKRYVPFIVFIVLTISLLFFEMESIVYVIPGWHTTIFPKQILSASTILIILFLVTIGYWILARKMKKISMIMFVLHLIFTLPIIIYLLFPSLFYDHATNRTELENHTVFITYLRMFFSIAFLTGQILFMVYWFKARFSIAAL